MTIFHCAECGADMEGEEECCRCGWREPEPDPVDDDARERYEESGKGL